MTVIIELALLLPFYLAIQHPGLMRFLEGWKNFIKFGRNFPFISKVLHRILEWTEPKCEVYLQGNSFKCLRYQPFRTFSISAIFANKLRYFKTKFVWKIKKNDEQTLTENQRLIEFHLSSVVQIIRISRKVFKITAGNSKFCKKFVFFLLRFRK
jgi:hypothetical protein